MADGYAQATGRPVLVNVHAAAGTGNAMGNLTNAQSAHVPVIVTSGQQARRYAALGALLTNVDAPTLARPLVKWSNEPLRPQDVPHALSTCILLATSAPAGPVYLSLPLDDWDIDADAGALEQLKARAVYGDPVVPEGSLELRRSRLAAASNPVMILGPGADDAVGWGGATRLAEQLALPVFVASSPSRCPFPTRHPNYRGILPSDIPGVTGKLAGHDLIAAFGAAIFRYHEFAEGDYLPAGAELWAVTSDPDEAARAPVGHILIGDPSDALTRLAGTMAATGRPPLTSRPAWPPRRGRPRVQRGRHHQRAQCRQGREHGHRARVDVGRHDLGPVRPLPPRQPVFPRRRSARVGPSRSHRAAARKPVPASAGHPR